MPPPPQRGQCNSSARANFAETLDVGMGAAGVGAPALAIINQPSNRARASLSELEQLLSKDDVKHQKGQKHETDGNPGNDGERHRHSAERRVAADERDVSVQGNEKGAGSERAEPGKPGDLWRH
jgi:hypothetical protein